MSTVIRVGVYGASGYTGQELIALLAHHAIMQVAFAVSDTHAGETAGNIRYIHQDEVDLNDVDLVFLCTPHGRSAPLAAGALAAGVKVVDLSADLRLKTAECYAQWYHHQHPVPALLPTPYGLPELNRFHLTHTNIIANPGCYATSMLLALAPLAKAGALKSHVPIVIDAKSGVSGAGRTPSMATHFVEVYGDLKPYDIGRTHRHIGEVEQELHGMNADVGPLIFSPHLLPVDRGILSAVYAPLADGWNASQIRPLYEDHYSNEPLVKVLPDGQVARLKDAVYTNKAVISLTFPTPEMVIIMSALDNLRKGAASQAIQNANILFNLPETTGLMES